MRRLKTCVQDIIQPNNGVSEGELCLALEHVESWTGKYREAGPDESLESQTKRFMPNDVLFGKLRPYLAKVARPNRPGTCVGEFLVLRADLNSMTPNYLEQLIRSKPVIETINSSTFGAKMPRTDYQFIGNIRIPLPPLPEQRAIADYLDHQTALMDALVAKKKRMIELLAERRQSLITHAVTKGLDPQAPTRQSGIQWIGDIPQHWEVRRLKTCVQDVIQPSNGVSEGELCLALEHVESWTGKYKEVGPEERLVSQTKRFMPNDVLFGKLGPHLAKVARPNKAGICVGEFLVLRADLNSMIPNYLEQLIRSKPVIEAINSSTFGVIMPRTDWKFIGNMRQPIPPLSEQRAIADYLDRQTAIMDALTEKLNRQIELLAERRQSLITHTVTGKIDVRHHKAPATPA